MKLAIIVEYRDYFDYERKSKPTVTTIEGALNAWNVYKVEKSRDYNYGDSCRRTTIKRVPSDDSRPKPEHKPHGRRFGHEPTLEEILNQAVEDAFEALFNADREYHEVRYSYGAFDDRTIAALREVNKMKEKVQDAQSERDHYLYMIDLSII